jgi:hypothetical protein
MSRPPWVRPAEEDPDLPLDDLDVAILAHVRAVHDELDPPPADLNDRVRFAISLENLDIEVSRLFEDTRMGAGARAAEPIRAVTFETDSLTIMVTISPGSNGGLRVEGWLAPAAALQVELRVPNGGGHRGRSRHVTAEESGRFVFDDVSPGLAQLTVHRDPGGPGMVVTSPLIL